MFVLFHFFPISGYQILLCEVAVPIKEEIRVPIYRTFLD